MFFKKILITLMMLLMISVVTGANTITGGVAKIPVTTTNTNPTISINNSNYIVINITNNITNNVTTIINQVSNYTNNFTTYINLTS
jgi:hypothetical protein